MAVETRRGIRFHGAGITGGCKVSNTVLGIKLGSSRIAAQSLAPYLLLWLLLLPSKDN